MDWVVHINNGSMEAKPIVLRLLPGEETIFNLKVVNHGEPSNISLEASNPVFKAVRLRKPDHYVVMEETIPIMARMPSNKSRLEGEILLTSSAGESRVPITLLRDSEDPGDDLEDPRLQVDEDLPDEQYGNDPTLWTRMKTKTWTTPKPWKRRTGKAEKTTARMTIRTAIRMMMRTTTSG